MFIPSATTLPSVGLGECGKTVLPSIVVAERTQNNVSLYFLVTVSLSPVKTLVAASPIHTVIVLARRPFV